MAESERTWSEVDNLVRQNHLPERAAMALFDATLGLRVRNATYRAYFEESPDEITDATASRDLRLLVEKGLLVPRGEKRGRHYTAAAPLLDIRRIMIEARATRDDRDPFTAAPPDDRLF